MFIGHFAPALAVRALSDKTPSLGTLFVAAQLVDIAFFVFVLGGIEHLRIEPGATAMNALDLYHYPYTHSLLGSLVWALGFGAATGLLLRNAVAGIWAALVVASHWILDLVSHRPDLTLAGDGSRFGLGLWNLPVAAIAVELTIIALGFWWYLRRTTGPVVPALVLAGVMASFQAFNWFGPEPAAADASFIGTGLAAFAVVIVFAYWTDSTRVRKNQGGQAVRG